MFASWSHLLLLLPAVPLAWEDFRRREVSAGWLALLGAMALSVEWVASGLRMTAVRAAANTGMLTLFGGALLLYHFWRRRPLRDFCARYFGPGDAAMMLATVPLFGPAGYVRFLLVSCLAALGWWIVGRPATIPLAGFMALTLAGYVVCETAGLWN